MIGKRQIEKNKFEHAMEFIRKSVLLIKEEKEIDVKNESRVVNRFSKNKNSLFIEPMESE